MPSAESLLANLNPQQREAVCHVHGPLLVLAGAGSGKTQVIVRRIAHLLATGAAQPGEILAVTFTNKAAGEMRERVAKLVGKTAAAALEVSTFHAFCVRVLRERIEHLGYRKTFTIAGEGDRRTLLRRMLADLDGAGGGLSADIVLEGISRMKSFDGSPPRQAAPETEAAVKYSNWMPELAARYQDALRAANTIDFDDLLVLTLRLWREHPAVGAAYRARYKFLLVDEFQDTNSVQLALVRELAGEHRNLCVVGDDDQSIYAWRGADPRNILEFERHFPGARVVKLEQNYRSTQTILDAANHVIAHNRDRRDKRLWSQLGAGRPIDWIVVGDEEHEAKMVVSWIQLIMAKTGARGRDFAVLYRSNVQSRPIELACRHAGIPYQVYGGQDFFERAEVKDVVAYLKLIANPYDEAACLRIVNTPRRGIGDTSLHRIHDLCRDEAMPFLKALRVSVERGVVARDAAPGIRSFLGLIDTYRKRFRARTQPLSALVAELLAEIGYQDELRRTCKTPEQAEVRWNNVEAVVEAVAAYEKEQPEGTLAAFLDQSALSSSDDRRFAAERRREGVSLMTIHSAKGLEFPFVLITGLEEGILPHSRSIQEETLEEERRLFYVALTRGKRHVTLFEAVSRAKFGKTRMSTPSRFLAELPEGLTKKSILAARDMVEARVAPPKPKPKRKRRPRKAMG